MQRALHRSKRRYNRNKIPLLIASKFRLCNEKKRGQKKKEKRKEKLNKWNEVGEGENYSYRFDENN